MTTDGKSAGDEWRYSAELPANRKPLAKAWHLLETYSGIAPEDIDKHVMDVVSHIKSQGFQFLLIFTINIYIDRCWLVNLPFTSARKPTPSSTTPA